MTVLKYDSSGNLVDSFDDPGGTVVRMVSEIETLKARVEELEREREELVRRLKGMRPSFEAMQQPLGDTLIGGLMAYEIVLSWLKWEEGTDQRQIAEEVKP